MTNQDYSPQDEAFAQAVYAAFMDAWRTCPSVRGEFLTAFAQRAQVPRNPESNKDETIALAHAFGRAIHAYHFGMADPCGKPKTPKNQAKRSPSEETVQQALSIALTPSTVQSFETASRRAGERAGHTPMTSHAARVLCSYVDHQYTAFTVDP